MKIIVNDEEKQLEVKRVREIFEKLGLNPEEYVVVKNGEVVLLDEPIEEKDTVELIPVVSGG